MKKDNNKNMNQIIFNYKHYKKKNVLFVIQLTFSILFLIFTTMRWVLFNTVDVEINNYFVQKNYLEKLYYNDDKKSDNYTYLGNIIIDKIDINYKVFNSYNEELLKILPCKFYGENLGENTNICIAGHNYNNDEFFSRLNELKMEDKIYIEDFNNKKLYTYSVYDIYETDESNLDILIQNIDYELTLLTCNNFTKKRIIIKAYMNNHVSD